MQKEWTKTHENVSYVICEQQSIHVILAWNEIGRSAIFGREIGVPDREVFSRQKLLFPAPLITVKCFIC